MSKNTIIGLLILIVVAVGGYMIWNANQPTAPVTPDTTQNPPAPQPTQNQSGAPTVNTNSGAEVSNSTGFVTGKVTPNGSPTSYWYEYGATTALGTRTTTQALGSGFVALPATGYITGLAANTQYYFRLSAKNAFGTVNGTTFAFSTNSNPPVPGTAPTTHSDAATSVSRTTANLNGTVNPNGAQSQYWFEYGETTDLGNTNAVQSAGDGKSAMPVSVSISNLKPLTKYYFRLNAQNQYGTVNGSILNFTTSGPAAPGAPSANTDAATNIQRTTVTFNGRANPNGDATQTWFEYGTDSLLGNLIGSGTPQQSAGAGNAAVNESADVTGLTANTRYYYRLVSRNSFGTVRGDIVTFKTKP